MRQIHLSLFDPPEHVRSGLALTQENILRSIPLASLFQDAALKEICSLYGYLMLLGQNLELELRVCLAYLSLALLRRGVSLRFTGDPTS